MRLVCERSWFEVLRVSEDGFLVSGVEDSPWLDRRILEMPKALGGDEYDIIKMS